MATLIKMHCTDCGFSTPNICFGPVMANPVCLGPALDTINNTIIEVDLDANTNNEKVAYTSDRIKTKNGNRNASTLDVFSYNFNEYHLPVEGNLCPSCNGFTLKVEIIGMID